MSFAASKLFFFKRAVEELGTSEDSSGSYNEEMINILLV